MLYERTEQRYKTKVCINLKTYVMIKNTIGSFNNCIKFLHYQKILSRFVEYNLDSFLIAVFNISFKKLLKILNK